MLLLYFTAMVALITLAPFQFFVPAFFDIAGVAGWQQTISSALIFVPLGFLYPLTRPGRATSVFHGAVIGGVLGGCLFAARLFEDQERHAVCDIVANAVGAGAGAHLLHMMNRRLRNSAGLANRMSLELPLVALIYLLIPVVLAASLSVDRDTLRIISLLPLTLLGARLIAAVQEHHFGPGGVFRKRSIALVAAGWTALGVFPLILREPAIGFGLVLLVALATAFESSKPWVRGRGTRERRFEPAVLRSTTPYIAAYFAVVILLPLSHGIADWHLAKLFVLPSENTIQVIRMLEPVAAFAMLGYVLAEARGRRELPFRATATRIATECALVALTMEASRGFQRDAGASAFEFALMVGASLLGAGIYHHQRQRVRWILIHADSARHTYVSHTRVDPRALAVAYVEPPRDAERSRRMLAASVS